MADFCQSRLSHPGYRGTFVAQSGQYGRDYFVSASGYLPSQYYGYNLRDSLTTIGTVVSNARTGTSWTCGTPPNNYHCSGFEQRYDYYDRLQAFDPAPFTPSARVDYGYVLWREQ